MESVPADGAPGKLFLGGISPMTQKEDLEAHFSQYGRVLDSVAMYKDGKHRGFGFVTFEDPTVIDNVLAEPQVIQGRTIDVKVALPGNEAPPPRPRSDGFAQPPMMQQRGGYGAPYGCGMPMGGAGYASAPQCGGGFAAQGRPPKGGGKGKPGFQGPTDKLFIGGITPLTTDASLSEYFSRYGEVVDVVVMRDKVTQKARGFGFVRFASEDSAELVVQDYSKHEIDGRWVEVKKAVPQDQMEPPPQRQVRPDHIPPWQHAAAAHAHVGYGSAGCGAYTSAPGMPPQGYGGVGAGYPPMGYPPMGANPRFRPY